MIDYTYTVVEDEQHIVATGMSLENALILVKALMEEYYADPMMGLTIVRNAPKE